MSDVEGIQYINPDLLAAGMGIGKSGSPIQELFKKLYLVQLFQNIKYLMEQKTDGKIGMKIYGVRFQVIFQGQK